MSFVLGCQILPAITALIDKRQKGRDDVEINSHMHNGRRAILVKELGVQTSLEKLNFLDTKRNVDVPIMFDKATQSSLVSLHEISTQTKKSATKKKTKTKQLNTPEEVNQKETEPVSAISNAIDDPVVKLLTPN